MYRRLAVAVAGLALVIPLGGCDARLWFICSLGVCGERFDIQIPAFSLDGPETKRTIN